MSIRVLALTRYARTAASTRQRFTQYFPYLAEQGIDVTLSPLLDDSWVSGIVTGKRAGPAALAGAYWRRLRTLLSAGDYDLIWISYELFPYLPGAAERLVRLTGVPYVLDYDDAIFHNYDAHPRAAVRGLLGRKLVPLMRGAAAVVCGNAYLRDYAARYCGSVPVVPTVVDCDLYTPARKPADKAPVIGWIGSPTTWANVEPVLPAIRAAAERHGARIVAVGVGSGARNTEGVELVAWSEATEVASVQAMDIGIMPLLDLPFQRGKCGYKLIQYMACGLPVVAAPVGVNSEIVRPGVTGLLAGDEAGWTAALDTLLGDPALRARMGVAARARAEELWSLQAHRARVADILLTSARRQGRDHRHLSSAHARH